MSRRFFLISFSLYFFFDTHILCTRLSDLFRYVCFFTCFFFLWLILNFFENTKENGIIIFIFTIRPMKSGTWTNFNNCHWSFIQNRLCPSEQIQTTNKTFSFIHLLVTACDLVFGMRKKRADLIWWRRLKRKHLFFSLFHGRLVLLLLDAFWCYNLQ